MAQRASGYPRRTDEDYASPPWVAAAVAPFLRELGVTAIWEPAPGAGQLAQALEAEGFKVDVTKGDFLNRSHVRAPCICTNPPYGAERRNDLACQFIRHALALKVRTVAMLLRVDFDSAKTRRDIFADEPRFWGKVTLLDRIMWFDGPSGPSDNHAFFIWDSRHRGPPVIRYAQNPEKIARRARNGG